MAYSEITLSATVNGLLQNYKFKGSATLIISMNFKIHFK